MNDPYTWVEKDLEDLITNSVKESIDLDYKSCPALQNNDREKNEISKDVSAFANSAGGTIVYGLIERGNIPTAIDSGFDPNVTKREWLEEVINSRIQRRIKGVKINQVDLTRSNPGKVAYVVCIPQSQHAPHQASDKKFYKRFNFQSIPMEEYEIRDISHRLEVPDLKITFRLETNSLNFQIGNPNSDPIEVTPAIHNDSIEPANYAVLSYIIDSRLIIVNRAGLTSNNQVLTIGQKKLDIQVLQENWSIPGKMPIFKGTSFRATNSPIQVAIKSRRRRIKTYLLGYELSSPKMESRMYFALLNVQSGQLSLTTQDLTSEDILSVRTLGWHR